MNDIKTPRVLRISTRCAQTLVTTTVAVTTALCLMFSTALFAQKKPTPPSFEDDTLIVFTPARPFIEKVETTRRAVNGLGMNIIFSGNGFGFGGFYQHELSSSLTLVADFFFSGRQNSDEYEVADWRLQRYIVPDKLNRLFMLPLTVGVQYKLGALSFTDALKPFVQAGIGSTFVIAAPYIRDNTYYEFFPSFGEATVYARFGGFIGLGTSLPSVGNSISNIVVRYYVIPFGGDGLESMNSSTTQIPPIRDFGGLFFTFTVGWRF